ncbi:MAG: hypothetical protein VXZ35_04300, partial [Pseudomonadota bacterium]|nr:hypothetical protein [Pseudomonadota bacterium]
MGGQSTTLAAGAGPWGVADGGSPPFGGLSKRQLELASFEALLQALGASRALDMMEGDDKEQVALIKAVATRLGITGRQHRRMMQALRRAEEPGEPAARRCSLTYRLRALQENLPADFDTDHDFFEWLERQAALVGCALHAMLWQFNAEFDDPDQSPAAGMEALVDALFMELLSVAQPTPHMHQLELRRSQGFAMGPYGACLQRVESLYHNILDITGGESDDAPAVVLPAPLNTHLYMSLLSCRFDADEPTEVVWNSGEMCRLVREVLQPVLELSDAEHYACMLHSAMCQLQYGLETNLPQLMPQLS